MMPQITMRISADDKKWLADVAASQGVSLSQFLRHAAVTQAHRVLGPPKIVHNAEER